MPLKDKENQHPTNFFARQMQAGRNCRKLCLFFAFAVFCIVIAVYFAFRLVCYINLITNITESSLRLAKSSPFLWWNPTTFILIFITVSLFIFTASLIKMQQLQKGGRIVAEMLGGRLVSNSTNIPAERQLLNIVEEMAIAAGLPVPPVYILDKEKSINAFAAGLTINDAVIAVTRGTLDQLSRDEIQGVIAHEFSHILHGDMRLNIQLMGITYGILIIGIIGGEILENHRISSKSAVFFIGGLLLTIIGYIGTFAGRLIQSAVSRQKEFLADASAVKFTRNPSGLASALKKIGGFIFGSQIISAKARLASHLFFEKTGTDILFSELLATHPPLIERIRLLDPSFDGIFTKVQGNAQTFHTLPQENPISGIVQPDSGKYLQPAAKAPAIINYVGSPTSGNLEYSSALRASIPEELNDLLKTSEGAAFLLYALLLGNDSKSKELQLNILQKSVISGAEKVSIIYDSVAVLKDDQRLPLVELAMPSLRGLSAKERKNFLDIIDCLVRADEKITLFEFCFQWIVRQYLVYEKERILGQSEFSHISQVGYQILILIRTLANAGNMGNAEAAHKAFNAGVAQIPELACKNPDFYYSEKINFAEMNTVLKKLSGSSFKIKQLIIDACAHCAFEDKTFTIVETELLRIISLALHCPLPPFVPQEKI
ncbi:MAG: M48 family metallopeptidase [Smithella sp.]